MGTNLPYRDFASIQASSPFIINKWWRTNNNVGLYYNSELRPYFDQTYHIAVFNYAITGSQFFTLKDWLLDISYDYESKGGNGLYIYVPVSTLDFSIQKAWLNKKLNTKLTLYDAFEGGKEG